MILFLRTSFHSILASILLTKRHVCHCIFVGNSSARRNINKMLFVGNKNQKYINMGGWNLLVSVVNNINYTQELCSNKDDFGYECFGKLSM